MHTNTTPPSMTAATRIQHLARRVGLLVALSIVGLRCSDPLGPQVCPNAVDVSASADTLPTISWQPACRAVWLFVTSSSGVTGLPTWTLSNDTSATSANPLLPPVQYGTAPAGMHGDPMPAPSLAGDSFCVTVWKAD